MPLNPATIRPALKAFLEQHLRIDEWGVGMPKNIDNVDHPPSIARDEPAKYSEEGFTSGYGIPAPITIEGSITFKILYRFDAAYRYMQLPIAQAEAKLLYVRSLLRHEATCILPEVDEIECDSKVVVAEQENKEWILMMQLDISIQHQAELSDLDISAPLFEPVV